MGAPSISGRIMSVYKIDNNGYNINLMSNKKTTSRSRFFSTKKFENFSTFCKYSIYVTTFLSILCIFIIMLRCVWNYFIFEEVIAFIYVVLAFIGLIFAATIVSSPISHKILHCSMADRHAAKLLYKMLFILSICAGLIFLYHLVFDMYVFILDMFFIFFFIADIILIYWAGVNYYTFCKLTEESPI